MNGPHRITKLARDSPNMSEHRSATETETAFIPAHAGAQAASQNENLHSKLIGHCGFIQVIARGFSHPGMEFRLQPVAR